MNALGDGDKALRGWLREQKAAYLHLTDQKAAQQALAGALNDNPFVLRPVNHGAPVQLKAAAVQSRAAAEFLAARYRDGTSLRLGVQALFEDVIWGEEERFDDAERAWQQLGLHLGFASTRPEKQYGTGPDNLWALTVARQAVTELKTGRTTDTIAKKEMDQLGGSIRWLNDHNAEVEALPVMLHPSRVCDAKATAVPGMRVIMPELFEKLKDAVTAYAAALASSPRTAGRTSRPSGNSSRTTGSPATGSSPPTPNRYTLPELLPGPRCGGGRLLGRRPPDRPSALRRRVSPDPSGRRAPSGGGPGDRVCQRHLVH